MKANALRGARMVAASVLALSATLGLTSPLASASVPPPGGCDTAWTYDNKDWLENNWYTSWIYMPGTTTSLHSQYIQYRTTTGWQGVSRYTTVNGSCVYQEAKRNPLQYSTQYRSPAGGPPCSTSSSWQYVTNGTRYTDVNKWGPYTFDGYQFSYKTRPTC